MNKKNGLGFVGSVIVDVVSEVLEPGNLVYSDGNLYLEGDDYESEVIEYSVGGMALNNSINIARMGAEYPIRIIGKIGQDDNGERIRTTLKKHRLSDGFLIETTDHPTSMTQVLYIKDSQGTVNRTFRYYFGALGSFTPSDIDYTVLENLKIVMVGYGLLLPQFDKVDDEYGAAIGCVLEKIRTMGITTCIDFATPKRDKWWKFKRFQKTLRWVDILSIGEDQSEGLTSIADPGTAVQSLVEDYGVNTAVVHCGDSGANYLYNTSTGLIVQRIFKVQPDEYAGNVGAGDAFTAGLLHGIHQGWDEATTLKYATAAAAISLGSLTSTGAMRKEEYIIEYMNTRPIVEQKDYR